MKQTLVDESLLNTAPYDAVGLVYTTEGGPDGNFRGSGSAVAERVVLTAAHVFYNDENAGWNRGIRWWQRAPTPTTFFASNRSTPARSFRVLAGYAAAADASGGDSSNAFERDTLALIFYRDVAEGHAAPTAVEQISGSGIYSFIGYPGINGGDLTEYGRMYAHGSGLNATFTRAGPTSARYVTSQLTSGQGQSGGPVFKVIAGTHKVVGIVVAGSDDYAYTIARAYDTEVDDLIAAAITDTEQATDGEIAFEIGDFSLTCAPVMRADGSIVVWTGDSVRAYSSSGGLLWQLPFGTGGSDARLIGRPDGKIMAVGYNATVIDGATGEFIREIDLGLSTGPDTVVLGSRNEIYTLSGNGLFRFSEFGAAEWRIPEINGNGSSVGSMGMGTDGNLYLSLSEKIVSVTPEGTIRWEAAYGTGNSQAARPPLAIGPEGNIYVRSPQFFAAFNQEGTKLWEKPESFAFGHPAPQVLADGTLVYLDYSELPKAVYFRPDGSEQESRAIVAGLFPPAVDSAGRLYLSDNNSIYTYTAEGPGWQNAEAGGSIYLGLDHSLWTYRNHTLFKLATSAGRSTGDWDTIGGADRASRSAFAPEVAPKILTQPQPVEVAIGYRVELSVVADGSYPLSFEWLKDGFPVGESIGPRLVLTNAQLSDAGNYTVVIRNNAGAITSTTVKLTVGEAKFGDVLWSTGIDSDIAPGLDSSDTTYALLNVAGQETWLAAVDSGGNELWRVQQDSDLGRFSKRSPMIGDAGNIYVAMREKVRSYLPEGSLRWEANLASLPYDQESVPYIAMAPNGDLWVRHGKSLLRYDVEGTLLQNINFTAAQATNDTGQIQVTAEGNILVPPYLSITPSGIISTQPYTLILPGLNGEAISYYNRNLSYSAPDGTTRLSYDLDNFNIPQLVSQDGLIASSSSFVFYSSNSVTRFPILTDPEALADLADSTFLISSASQLQRINRQGNVVESIALTDATRRPFGVMSKAGVLVGGSRLGATFIGISPSRGIWPQRSATAANSNRVAATATVTESGPVNVTITEQGDPFEGFSLTLTAAVVGTGQYSYQWYRGEAALVGETKSTLTFASLSAADAADYHVFVRNIQGSLTSDNFTVTVGTATAFTTGFHPGIVKLKSDGTIRYHYALLALPNRSIKLFLPPASGMQASTNFTEVGPTGFIKFHPSDAFPSAKYIGDELSLLDPNLTAELIPIDAATAPNGLPVGFYEGAGADSTSRPVNAAVLPDGQFWWVRADKSGGFRDGGVTQMPADSEIFSTSAVGFQQPSIQVTASSEGILRFSHTEAESDPRTDFTALWTGRTRNAALINLSSRSERRTELPPTIMGFVVEGNRNLLVRGIGPGLERFDLARESLAAAPELVLTDLANNLIASAGAWTSTLDLAALRETFVRVGAFALNEGLPDSALVQSLDQGNFTARIEGGPGIALTEAFDASIDTSGRLLNFSARGFIGRGENSLIGGFTIGGSQPVTLLIRAIGPGLLPFFAGSELPLATEPRLRLFAAGQPEPVASVTGKFHTDYVHVTRVAETIGAFTATTNDTALIVTLEPGIYTAVADNPVGDEGIGLVEIYLVP